MQRIIVLVGLPASGKTTETNRIQQVIPNIEVFDDFLGVHKPIAEKGLFALLRSIEEGHDVVCNDVFLCREEDRQVFCRLLTTYAPNAEVTWKFYQNDPDKCHHNADTTYDKSIKTPFHIKRRDDRHQLIDCLTTVYSIPEEYTDSIIDIHVT